MEGAGSLLSSQRLPVHVFQTSSHRQYVGKGSEDMSKRSLNFFHKWIRVAAMSISSKSRPLKNKRTPLLRWTSEGVFPERLPMTRLINPSANGEQVLETRLDM
jgi:hypothetical protein